MSVKAPRVAAVQSTVAWVVILPATMLVLSSVADSLVRLLKGPKAQQVFRLVSETWSQASSGCPCVTDGDERRKPGICLGFKLAAGAPLDRTLGNAAFGSRTAGRANLWLLHQSWLHRWDREGTWVWENHMKNVLQHGPKLPRRTYYFPCAQKR